MLKRYLSGKCLIPNFGGEPRPFFKLSDGHFLFHIPCIMRLVRSIVGLPDRIVLALVIVTTLRANVAAGLAWLVRKWVITVSIIPCAADQKKFTAVLAEVWNVILLQPVEEIVIDK